MKRIALAAAVLLSALSACGKPEQAWKSPADDAALVKLAEKSLRPELSRQERARLFFLWGQELASRAQGSPATSSGGSEDSLKGAIAAFEKVVDLNSVLVPESRRNLEILWKGQNQGGGKQNQQNGKQDQQNGKQDQQNGKQDQQNGKQDQQNGKQDQQNGKQDQRNGKQDQRNGKQDQQNGKQDQQNGKQDQQNGKQDQQNGKQDQQNGKQDQQSQQNQKGQAQKGQDQGDGAKDLSALVRDKEGGKDIEAALQAEMERQARSERLQAEKGNMSPVEKDW